MTDSQPIRCIGILGLGRVGLVTALGLAEKGWTVVAADIDGPRVQKVAQGVAPFYEPKVKQLLRKHLASGRFSSIPDVADAIRRSDILFVCVGTPPSEDASADLSQVDAAAQTIAQNLNGYKLIVEKTTAPVRTTRWMQRTILRYRVGNHEFDVACNPEFLREGTGVDDFLHPHRIVIGAESERAKTWLRRIYEPFGAKILMTDLNTAEIIKHSANAFLALKVSYINMVSDLCEAVGANISQVAAGLGMDPRIGPAFLKAGIGYGGFCFPKDLRAFIRVAEESGVDFSLLREVERINNNRVDRLVRKTQQALWVLKDKRLAVWGLAFKPQTDDVRGAQSLNIVRQLKQAGALLRLYDPQAMDCFRSAFPEENGHLAYCQSAAEAAEGAHAVLVLTEWEEFINADWNRLRQSMAVPIVVDGRDCLDAAAVEAAGFEYHSIGQPSRIPKELPVAK